MVNPIYGDPLYRILEIIGPNTIDIKIEITDFKRFVERLMTIKDGGTLILDKRTSSRRVQINISNIDSGVVKTLGDKS